MDTFQSKLTSSAENTRQDSAASTLSLESVAKALPRPQLLTSSSIYTSRDPVRLSSLNDISESLTLAQEQRPRSASSVSVDSTNSGRGTPSANRRKPPAPPSKKHSTASSVASSAGYSSDERSNTPGPGYEDDLVEEGAKGVPAPIIEVNDVPIGPGWVTFSAT